MDIEEFSKVDILMSQLQKMGKTEFHGVVKGVTCRLPTHQYSAIEAFSRHTGMSKNKVIVELLEVSLDIAIRGLDRANRKAFNQHESAVLAQLAEDGYGETTEGL